MNKINLDKKPLNPNICHQVDDRLRKLFTMDKNELRHRLFDNKDDETIIHEMFDNFHC